MTADEKVPALDAYWRRFEPNLRPFSPEERRFAIGLYRELAKGQAIEAVQLAQQLGRAVDASSREALAFLQSDGSKGFVYSDAQGRVVGFGGLSTIPMHHSFEVDGRALSTWCALDSLFIPAILDRTARVTSSDPESGAFVRLVVAPDRIESVEAFDEHGRALIPRGSRRDGVVVSFIRLDERVFGTSAVEAMKKFCHFVFFFSSRESGERWTAKHPGTFLYSLDEAFELGKRFNARKFGLALPGRVSSTG